MFVALFSDDPGNRVKSSIGTMVAVLAILVIVSFIVVFILRKKKKGQLQGKETTSNSPNVLSFTEIGVLQSSIFSVALFILKINNTVYVISSNFESLFLLIIFLFYLKYGLNIVSQQGRKNGLMKMVLIFVIPKLFVSTAVTK